MCEDQDSMPEKEEGHGGLRAEGTVADKMDFIHECCRSCPQAPRHIVMNIGHTQAGTGTKVNRALGPHKTRHTDL